VSKAELVDAYIEGRITRRTFMRRLVAAGVSLSAASAYAAALGPAARAAPLDLTADAYDGYDGYDYYGPTAVRVLRFSVKRSQRGVNVAWKTAFEAETLGFNVFRSGGLRTRRLNRSLLAAKGHRADYVFVDRSARRGKSYTYRLQSVDLDGTRTWLGAATVPKTG